MNIEWVTPYRAGVVRYVENIVGTDAEDIVQDMLIGLLEMQEGVGPRDVAKRQAWLYAVARRFTIDALRRQSADKRSADPTVSQSLSEVFVGVAEFEDGSHPVARFDPEDVAGGNPETALLLREQVARAKSSLSPGEQATFDAMLTHNPSDFAGIAEAIRTSVKTAQNRVYAVRRKLAALFAE